MVSRWGHFFSRVRHPGVLDREKVPERCNGLHARRMAVLSILRALSGRPVHRELLRSVVLDLTPIISTTACHQRNYVERYSRFNKGGEETSNRQEHQRSHLEIP